MSEITLAMIVFVAAALIIVALCMVVSAFFSGGEREVNRRMHALTKSGDPFDQQALRLLKNENDWKRYPFFSEFPPVFNLPLLFTQAGMSINIGRWSTLTLGAALLAGAALGLAINLLIGVLAFAAIATLSYGFVLSKRSKRLAQIEALLAQSLEIISRSLRAGHPFSMGLQMVSSEMSQPISEEFGIVYQEHRMGLPLEDALQKLVERVPLLDIRFFTLAVMIHHQTGGDLSEILDNLAKVIRERFKIKGQIKALTAEGRLSGWVLSILPVFVFFLMLGVNREYIMLLLTTPQGLNMLYAAGVLQIIGMLFIRKIVNIKI